MSAGEANSQIPQLDLTQLARASFLADLLAAAHDVGFFYITGHGIDPRLPHDLMQAAQRFFSLPEADKLAIEMVNSPHFRGYNRVASERTRGLPDWREQIDIGAERPALPRDTGLPS
jgi:isopenicillin N synthase-like dioxygenase